MGIFIGLLTLVLPVLATAGCGEGIRFQLAEELERLSGLVVPAEAIVVHPSAGSDCPPASLQSPKLQLSALGLRFDGKSKSYHWAGNWLDEKSGKRLPTVVTFTTPPLQPMAKLRVAVNAGGQIREDLLEESFTYWRPGPRQLAGLGLAAATGKLAKRNLAAGATLRGIDLASATDVARGETLAAQQKIGAALLRFPVIALDHACIGELLRVRKKGSARMMLAVLKRPGEVEIVSPKDAAPAQQAGGQL